MSQLKYDIRSGVKKIKTKTALTFSAVSLGAAGLFMAVAFPLGAHATSSTIYNNIPIPQPGNVASVGFEATGTSEFGGQVAFAGSDRQSPTVTVLMSSWGCQSGHWTSGDCTTTPGSTFSVPITLNVYNVGSGNSVGSLVTTITQTFNIPFRPSADHVNCPGVSQNVDPNSIGGKWYDGATCYNGFATPISFSLTGVTLPNNAIVSVAYNTSDYGAVPYGHSNLCNATTAGCGYDSLNVGVDNALAAGTQPTPSDAYQLTLYDSCSNGAVTPFGIDTGCWTGNQPAFKVDASTPTVTVTIDKFVNGVQATAGNTSSTTFPMESTWSATNIGSGTGMYALEPTGFNNPNPYMATTSDMSLGANYTTHEVLGSTVAATCTVGGAPYALAGYSTGSSLAAAQAGPATLAVPNFSNLQNNMYVVVWNTKCPTAPVFPHPTDKDQCKNDGWKTLFDSNNRAFKNQGDCVSYVATQGKIKANG